MGDERIGEYELLESLPVVDIMQRYRARRAGDPRELELRVSIESCMGDSEWEELAVQWRGFLRCSHPHVQQVLDFGLSEERPYVVYAWVDARPLRELLVAQREQGRFLSGPAAAALLLPACAGLAELAQSLGFVHGSLGPDTIWVRPSGASILSGVVEPRWRRRLEKSVGRALVRPCWRYLSPEQARGRPLAPPSDVFSLGMLLYELVSGHLPLGGETDLEILQQLISPDPVPPIAQQVPELDPVMAAVIDRALQKNVAHRYGTAQELAQALAAAAGPVAPVRIDAAPVHPTVSPRAAGQPTPVVGLRIESCAMKWEELTPRPPIDGHPARHCARCDQAVVQAEGAEALGQALQGRCLHLRAPVEEPRGFWKRLLRR
jgi:serine/threonine-protein kinase